MSAPFEPRHLEAARIAIRSAEGVRADCLERTAALLAKLEQEIETAIWIDCPRGASYRASPNMPTSEQVLFVANAGRGEFIAKGWWDFDSSTWFDSEKNADGDRYEYSPEQVRCWRPLPRIPEKPSDG